MKRSLTVGLNTWRLRLWLTLFFVALAIPSTLLIQYAYSQLKWEALHHHQVLAEELAGRVDQRVGGLIAEEEVRAFGDYAFLVVAGDPAANFLQPSSLSAYPVDTQLPGVIGYFQVDAAGVFSTPMVPQGAVDVGAYGIADDELERRLALERRIGQILSDNRLVDRRELRQPMEQAPAVSHSGAPMPGEVAEELASAPMFSSSPSPAQQAFDDLSSAAVETERATAGVSTLLGKAKKHADASPGGVEALSRQSRDKRTARKERSVLPAPVMAGGADAAPSGRAIRIFESEIDPFEFSLLGSGHGVLFRKVWRDGQRYIQGVLLDQQQFLAAIVDEMFSPTVLAQVSDLTLLYQGSMLARFDGRAQRGYPPANDELQGRVLYQMRLSYPLGDVALVFTVNKLPAGPGAVLIVWLGALLFVVLCGGSYAMYRLGVRQLKLARQQRDFVSAVSHELKTPLTSIRMYGEMLREGWVPEEKKRSYYDYIFDESERLSRLIANVLQLARMTRNEAKVVLNTKSVAQLMDGLQSKVSTQIEHAGFELHMIVDSAASAALIRVDEDYFVQIVINLVDNAIKFSARDSLKRIDLSARLEGDSTVIVSVRDYGPGVARNQMKKIFQLFYRSESELTRETVGTGIGLALVRQMAHAMGGVVDVCNREPGAEFSVAFPVAVGNAMAAAE